MIIIIIHLSYRRLISCHLASFLISFFLVIFSHVWRGLVRIHRHCILGFRVFIMKVVSFIGTCGFRRDFGRGFIVFY